MNKQMLNQAGPSETTAATSIAFASGFPGDNLPANAGDIRDAGSIPGSG